MKVGSMMETKDFVFIEVHMDRGIHGVALHWMGHSHVDIEIRHCYHRGIESRG
jgi:hypothetical protein